MMVTRIPAVPNRRALGINVLNNYSKQDKNKIHLKPWNSLENWPKSLKIIYHGAISYKANTPSNLHHRRCWICREDDGMRKALPLLAIFNRATSSIENTMPTSWGLPIKTKRLLKLTKWIMFPKDKASAPHLPLVSMGAVCYCNFELVDYFL